MTRLLPYIIAGSLILAALTGWQGYRMGYAACDADHAQERLDQIEAGEKLNADRRKLAQERDDLARQLSEQANADPVVVHRCLGPSRVQRLNALD